MQRFDYRFDSKYEQLLRLIGINAITASVEIGEGRLLARFGPWSVETPLSNIKDVRLTGGYTWYRAIGPHLSLKDKGISFGTNVDRGVCICFHEPVAGIDPLHKLKHPGLTVTVADVDALVDAIHQAAPALSTQ